VGNNTLLPVLTAAATPSQTPRLAAVISDKLSKPPSVPIIIANAGSDLEQVQGAQNRVKEMLQQALASGELVAALQVASPDAQEIPAPAFAVPAPLLLQEKTRALDIGDSSAPQVCPDFSKEAVEEAAERLKQVVRPVAAVVSAAEFALPVL